MSSQIEFDNSVEVEEPREITAYDILKTLTMGYFNTQAVAILAEFSPYHSNLIRLDAYAWSPQKSWGYEIKVSRSDFLGDKKWLKYLDFCNYFYFVCPEGVIASHELPDNIGLIYARWDKNLKHKNYLSLEIIKRPKKLPDILEKNKEQIYKGIIFKFAYNKNILRAAL